MLATLGRLLWVPIAFAISVALAAWVLVSLGYERVTQAMHGRGPETDSVAALIELMRQAHLLASATTIVPALLVIIVGEVARIRSSLYYILGLGAAAAAMPLLAKIGQSGSLNSALPPTVVWQVFATAGFAGGLAYWFLAGRRA